jgi:4-carboxymuconolactone decarboxylase
MARVKLIDPDSNPAFAELAANIRGQRRGKFINIYRLLLQSPTLCGTWFDFNNAVRWQTELDGRLREIIIIRIGHLNGSEYTLRQHQGALAKAEGLSAAASAALKSWRGTDHFSAKERAALAFADAMTEDIAVPDEIFEPLRGHFDERQIVELAVLIGSYNMHTRVFRALEADLEQL